MTLNYTIFKVAYCTGALPATILKVLTNMTPSMENTIDGTGQYIIEDVLAHFVVVKIQNLITQNTDKAVLISVGDSDDVDIII